MIIVEITLFVESDNYRPTSREIRARFSFLSNCRLSEKEEKKRKREIVANSVIHSDQGYNYVRWTRKTKEKENIIEN